LKSIASDIFRQRLLVEFYYEASPDERFVSDYLLGLATHLDLRTYGEPIVFAPVSGMGREENSGFDAFVPLIDSGISCYVWSKVKFFSAVIYTCKGFDEKKAVIFSKKYWKARGEVVTSSF
jgi:S-adenosylmethionine decarboxylase